MPELAYTAKTPATTPSTTPSGWPSGWSWPGPPWPPGWPIAASLQIALGADEADVDGAFNIVVTAYKADGSVDTAYATAVNLTHGSATLSLQTSGGAALTQIAGASFVNGVATVAARMHQAAILAADEVVTITATSSTVATMTDSDAITINNTAYTDPGVANVLLATDYRFNSVTKTGELVVRDLDAVAISGFCYVSEANPAVNYNGLFSFSKTTGASIERRLYIKFAQPLSKFRALIISRSISSLVVMNLYRIGAGLLDGLASLAFDFVESDFDPATLTWTSAAALTHELESTTQPTIGGGNDTSTGALAITGDLRPRAHAADVTPAAPIYGLRIRVSALSVDDHEAPPVCGASCANNMSVDPTSDWLVLGTKA